MSINIFQGNVLDAKADAIILSIDGSAKGMEGNLCRQLEARWSDVWRDVQDEISYPIPLGKVFDHEPVVDSPFGLIMLASTLHHKDALHLSVKKGIISSVTEKSLKLAAEYRAKAVASAIMSGGWRLTQEAAFLAMIDGYENARQNNIQVDLNIYILDPEQYERIKALAQSIGWRSYR
jgi:hypothetical protein